MVAVDLVLAVAAFVMAVLRAHEMCIGDSVKDDVLCIPTAFVSYTGEALAKKTPLLRSMNEMCIRDSPSTMLTTPAGSSPSTACGIISCAVTHTMQPAAALMMALDVAL